MLHVRVTAPRHVCDAVVERITGDPAVANVALLRGAAVDGGGDLVLFDVAREAANPVLDGLRGLGVVEAGSIAISEAVEVLGDSAARAERRSPGHPSDGVIWEGVENRARDDSRLSWSFLAFLILATLIAGIGRYLDQPILIIGAMVVGPEFAPLSAICVALVRRRPGMLRPAIVTLTAGFVIAIVLATVAWAVAYLAGAIDPVLATTGEQTEFIVKPDIWSFIVALLAGCAGILSLTSAKSSALVGVFISITTVPAAATIALTLAVGAWDEAAASGVQLGINLLGILVAGVATLWVQTLLSGRRRRPRG
ncbi:DUF389 domain-containing protein [Pseudolysinimonas sp.]|uniref:DUF389 domain-containing protein n=1 Tax=Pseudolysinimonas sp. TaxID=2680009 RepID=UPI00286C35CC|nr:DUF389 domain-containing protein [Pseudolysinimonas sp.]